MNFINNFFKIFSKNQISEDDYVITISNDNFSVEHLRNPKITIKWNELVDIKLINTDKGPFENDVWLVLNGRFNQCVIPNNCKGYEEIFNIVSKFDNFNFENVIKSMTSTGNEEFLLWRESKYDA